AAGAADPDDDRRRGPGGGAAGAGQRRRRRVAPSAGRGRRRRPDAQPAAHALQYPGRFPRPRTPARPHARAAWAVRARFPGRRESRMKPSTPPAALRPRHRRAAHAAPSGDRRALRLLACALAAVALGACAIADTPAPAPLEPPPAFRHAPAASTAASTTAGGKLELPPADEWWQAFEDAELDALGRRAAAGNQDIRAAA